MDITTTTTINHAQNVMRIARPVPEAAPPTSVTLARKTPNVPMACTVAHTTTCVCSMEPIARWTESLLFPR
jgi:hypothetical protein